MMKKHNTSTNTIEQLEDLLEKGILTEEEYEAKKQQIASTESEISQEPNKQSLVEKARQLYAAVSPKLAPVKDFAMKRKKLTCIIMALILLVVGFLPGYSIGRKHPSKVHLVFGSSDKIEVKGKGSKKNPYHLNEDITFKTFHSDTGKVVTYTVNISRVLRPSAAKRYMNGNNKHDSGALIGSVQANWEGDDVNTVTITPRIGMVFQGDDGNYRWDAEEILNRSGGATTDLLKGRIYENGIMLIPNEPEKEYDHIQIEFSTKEAGDKMVTYKIYVAFDPKVIES